MPLTSACGSHCGIRANAEDTMSREAHCGCGDPCHSDGSAPPPQVIRVSGQDAPAAPADLDGRPLRGVPMCARWYERAGDYRPWHYARPDVLSDVTLVSVELRADAVPYEQSPPSTLANDDPERRSTPAPDVDVWAAREGGVH
jgi:hypothetical protein